jgi:hypothetical protein
MHSTDRLQPTMMHSAPAECSWCKQAPCAACCHLTGACSSMSSLPACQQCQRLTNAQQEGLPACCSSSLALLVQLLERLPPPAAGLALSQGQRMRLPGTGCACRVAASQQGRVGVLLRTCCHVRKAGQVLQLRTQRLLQGVWRCCSWVRWAASHGKAAEAACWVNVQRASASSHPGIAAATFQLCAAAADVLLQPPP